MEIKKRLVKDEIYFNVDWTYGVRLEQIEKDIKVLKEKGCNYIEIEPYNCTISIEFFNEREETEEELEKRKQFIKSQEELQRKVDLEKYNYLKNKLNL